MLYYETHKRNIAHASQMPFNVKNIFSEIFLIDDVKMLTSSHYSDWYRELVSINDTYLTDRCSYVIFFN